MTTLIAVMEPPRTRTSMRGSLFPKKPTLLLKPPRVLLFSSVSSLSFGPPVEECALWRPSYRDIRALTLVMLLGERKDLRWGCSVLGLGTLRGRWWCDALVCRGRHTDSSVSVSML